MRRALKIAGILGLLAYLPMILLYGGCVTGLGPWAVPGVELFIIVPFAALAASVLALPFMLFRRTRKGGLVAAVTGIGMVILFILAMGASAHLRRLAFQLAAERADPLVEAIERFARDQGKPPDRLTDLVPRYLPRLPSRLPELELVVGKQAGENYGGNDWVLMAMVSTGLLNLDQFIYYPNQRYPEYGHGGSIERIGRWAYVHE